MNELQQVTATSKYALKFKLAHMEKVEVVAVEQVPDEQGKLIYVAHIRKL